MTEAMVFGESPEHLDTEMATESPTTNGLATLPTENASVESTAALAVGTKVRISNPARTAQGGYVGDAAFGKIGEITGVADGVYDDPDDWRVTYDSLYGYQGRDTQVIGTAYLTPITETDLLRAEMDTLKAQVGILESERDTLKEMAKARERDLAEFKTRVQEIGYRYAEDNNMCRVFDQCMEEIGLPGREREWSACIEATVHIHVNVTASTEDEAGEQVTDAMVLDRIRELANDRYGGLELSSFDVSTVDAG